MFNVTKINDTEVQLINDDLDVICQISTLNLSSDQISLIDFYDSFGVELRMEIF